MGTFRVASIAARWWGLDGSNHWFAYLVVPIVVSAGFWQFGLIAGDPGPFYIASAFLAGTLLNMLFRAFGWSGDVTDELSGLRLVDSDESKRIQELSRTAVTIKRAHASLSWATLVAVALLGVSLLADGFWPISGTDALPAVGTVERYGMRAFTIVMAGMVSHLVVVLTAIIMRVFYVTRTLLDDQMDEAQRAVQSKTPPAAGDGPSAAV